MRGKPAGSIVTIRLIINRHQRMPEPEDILEADVTGLLYFIEEIRTGPKLHTIRATKLDPDTFTGAVDFTIYNRGPRSGKP